MKAALCWLLLGAVPAFGQTGGGQVAPFAVYTHFDQEPAAPVLDSLKQELTSILADVGLPVAWRSLDAHREGESFEALAVITFKGTCSVDGLISERVGGGALGRTHVTDGQIIPFSDVDCGRIRAFLSHSLVPLWRPDRDRLYGRAIARVLAHELYHIFTQTRHHGSSGLAEPSYTARELMADGFSFAEPDRKMLATLVAAHRLSASGGLPQAGQTLFVENGCARCHGFWGEGTPSAPGLRPAAQPVGKRQLAAKLAAKDSEMYRRARGLRAHWSLLPEPDLQDLIAYLNTAID